MKSIKTRLSVYLSLAAMFTAVIIGVITYRHTLIENEELLDYQLRQIALSLRDQGVVADPSYYQQADGLDVLIQIWTSNGSMLYLSVPGAPVLDKATLGFTNVDTAKRRWRVYSMATRDRIIQVAQPLELRSDLAASAAIRSLTPLLAFVPLMALMIWWTVSSSLSSLRRVAGDVRKRDARSLDEVAMIDIPEEVAPLISALNSLLLRLKKAFSTQRNFVADAAHELRSPLTALKLQLQLLASAKSDETKIMALDQLNQGVDRATHLIEQLLTAARIDWDDEPIRFVPTDLVELTRQTVADLYPAAHAKLISVEFIAPEKLLVNAEPERLRILIRNLVDNAIRYSPEHGTLNAVVEKQGTQCLLTIEDSGPGVPPNERKRIFNRFYRSSNTSQPGSGLGLSIVKNIAEEHGAQIELADSTLGGLKVVVAFHSS